MKNKKNLLLKCFIHVTLFVFFIIIYAKTKNVKELENVNKNIDNEKEDDFAEYCKIADEMKVSISGDKLTEMSMFKRNLQTI